MENRNARLVTGRNTIPVAVAGTHSVAELFVFTSMMDDGPNRELYAPGYLR